MNAKNAIIAVALVAAVLAVPLAEASHAAGHDATKENVTRLKDGTIETLAEQ